jgi:hypothetical protein
MAGKTNQLEENARLFLDDVDVFEIVDGYLNTLKRKEKFIIDSDKFRGNETEWNYISTRFS